MAEYKLKHTGEEIDEKLDKIDELSEEIADLQDDVSTDVTIKDYEHLSLKANEKLTIYNDDRYDHAPRVFLGKNLFPNTLHVKNNVYATLGTSLVTDGYNFTVKGTPTSGSYYSLVEYEGSNDYFELPEGLSPGDSIDIYVFTDKNNSGRCPTLNVRIYDENKQQLVRIYVQTVDGVSYSTKLNQVIPEGAKYVRYELAYGTGAEYNRTMHPVIVKSGTEIINDLTFENGLCEITLDSDYDVVCTAPYESSIIRERTFNQYVSEMNNLKNKEQSSIVTPEMFGAYADRVHDDTQAIQKAIDYGFANNKRVICGGKYLTAFPIHITGSFNFVEINYIDYRGTDCAVVISGSYNNVKIPFVYSTRGAGVRLQSDENCSYNDIYIGYALTNKNSVEYIITVGNIVSNRLTFNRLTVSGDGNCIYQTPTLSKPKGCDMGNNEFIGGHLSGNGWAVYGAKGADTYITPRFENVKNGIYCDNVGFVRVFSPRCPEFVLQAYEYTDNGYVHYPDKGILFAINVATSSTELKASTKGSGLLAYGFTGMISPWNFDLKGAMLEVSNKDDTISPISKSYPGATEVQVKLWGKDSIALAYSFLIFGNHILIKDPIRKRKKTIMTNDHGYSGDYSVTYKNDEFFIYDEFTVGESGCDYTLPPSYDQIAFDHFYVNQPDGTYCTLRDWRGTVVFDGESLGSGRYEVDIRCAEGKLDNYLNEGQVWYIRRVDNGELVATMPLTV